MSWKHRQYGKCMMYFHTSLPRPYNEDGVMPPTALLKNVEQEHEVEHIFAYIDDIVHRCRQWELHQGEMGRIWWVHMGTRGFVNKLYGYFKQSGNDSIRPTRLSWRTRIPRNFSSYLRADSIWPQHGNYGKHENMDCWWSKTTHIHLGRNFM